MAMACKGIDILKRVLCLLLCFVVLFCFFMVPRAGAVVLEGAAVYWAGALIGSVLVAAGYTFHNASSMAEVGASMCKSITSAGGWAAKKIGALASWAVANGKSIGGAAIRVGQDLYSAIVDAFNASYADGVYSASDDGAAAAQSFDDLADAYRYVGKTFSVGTPIHLYCNVYNSSYGKKVPYHFYKRFYAEGNIFVIEQGAAPVAAGGMTVSVNKNNKLDGTPISSYLTTENTYGGIGVLLVAKFMYADGSAGGYGVSLYDSSSSISGPFVVSASEGVYYPVGANDVAYPSDDTLVKMPDLPKVNSATGAVTYPADMPYTKDAVAAPYPVDADGIKVPDIPYDKVVDRSTGKTLDDADTGTDTDTDNPSKPGTDTSTDTNVNWPDAPSLSLPKLISTKFPFCIPFDVARLIGLLEAEPKAPRWVVPLQYADIVDEEIVLDFDDFSDVLRIVRWGEIMLFVAGLIVITRNYIKW